jgi:hypothetical protein
MRSASNETALTRLLTSAYEQLDKIKSRYNNKKENNLIFNNLVMDNFTIWNMIL